MKAKAKNNNCSKFNTKEIEIYPLTILLLIALSMFEICTLISLLNNKLLINSINTNVSTTQLTRAIIVCPNLTFLVSNFRHSVARRPAGWHAYLVPPRNMSNGYFVELSLDEIPLCVLEYQQSMSTKL